MNATRMTARVVEKTWLTPTVFRVRFQPARHFHFTPGQFVAVILPGDNGKRLYSLASSPESSRFKGYELCVKFVEGGRGSAFLGGLEAGDTFEICGPYGEFKLAPARGKNVCFIATGTGIGPVRAMVTAERFQEERPNKALVLAGVRGEKEIVFADEIRAAGVDVVHAVSGPGEGYQGFHGRVTDYLKALPRSWDWKNTDFYLCGNPEMVNEAKAILASRGVPSANIRYEAFKPAARGAAKAPASAVKPSFALPWPFLRKQAA